jgi:ABC-type multidrug transport system fused ATPase/permease subunit
MCVGGAVLALRQNTPLSSLLLVALPAMAVIFGLILRRLRPLFRLVQERVDKINQMLREQITGVRVIRAFVRDDRERERFTRTSTELMDVSIRAGWLMAMMFPLVMLLANACSVAVVWFGGGQEKATADGLDQEEEPGRVERSRSLHDARRQSPNSMPSSAMPSSATATATTAPRRIPPTSAAARASSFV